MARRGRRMSAPEHGDPGGAPARHDAPRRAGGLGRRTVGEVVAAACERYGNEFAALVQSCRVWVNGEPALETDAVTDSDEVAILPPVSGGV